MYVVGPENRDSKQFCVPSRKTVAEALDFANKAAARYVAGEPLPRFKAFKRPKAI
jgi:hypothetical protein